MIQFYASDIDSSQFLDPGESGHCVRVLRKKKGDEILLTDGKGSRYECLITDDNPRRVRFEILNQIQIPKSWNNNITLAVAPTKNADRMAWLVEKATEIGVDKIIFVACRNSERRVVNVDRLRRNAISAMNQSLKTFLPQIEEIQPLEALFGMDGSKYFGYCSDDTERRSFVKDYKPGENVVITIGPEGDFSKDEVEAMIHEGFKPVTFGDERLRTETAALYAVTAIHVLESLY